jgi:hypothetical protein
VKRIIVAFLLLLTSAAYAQDCKNILQFPSATVVGLSLCKAPFPAVGDKITIEANGQSADATVEKSDFTLGTQIVQATPTQGNIIEMLDSSTATVKYGATTLSVEVQPPAFAANNTFEYKWSIGPATKGDQDGDTEGGSGTTTTAADTPASDDSSGNTGALNLKYSLDYAHGGIFGIQSNRLLQSTASVSIDTTDQDSSDFIDNNRAAVGLNLIGLGAGRLWMHGEFGVEARLEKAFHHDIHNADAVAKVGGWIPVARPVNLFGKKQFITVPLTFSASYGYRNRQQEKESFDGRVFEATALYYFFALDRFMISLNGTLTVNDLSNRATTVPRTQRMYKATIAYLEDPDNPSNGFKVLTSIENGSFGVMLKEVRQYFVGVGFSKLSALTGGN